MTENGHCEISYLMKNLNPLRDSAQFDSLKFSDLIPLSLYSINNFSNAFIFFLPSNYNEVRKM